MESASLHYCGKTTHTHTHIFWNKKMKEKGKIEEKILEEIRYVEGLLVGLFLEILGNLDVLCFGF
jgi:hypothetical protein